MFPGLIGVLMRLEHRQAYILYSLQTKREYASFSPGNFDMGGQDEQIFSSGRYAE
jgi:hypothetical protein